VPYHQQKVHQKKYFAELLQKQKEEMPSSMPELLRLSRSTVVALTGMQRQLIQALERDALLAAACGAAGQHSRRGPRGGPDLGAGDGRHQALGFREEGRELCGLCGAEKSSGGKTERPPISKQRNKHLQTILVEAAKRRWNAELALVYERAQQKGNRNRATLAVARKRVAYLMAVDREARPFDPHLSVADTAA
jgi:transposase